VAAAVLAAVAGVSAHRQDEYLQAARIAIDPAGVRLELSLTPGMAVADAVIRDTDVNGDAVFSPAEQRAYAERVLRRLSLHVDDRPVPLTLGPSTFPAATTLRGGDAVITLRIDAGMAPAPGAHRVAFRNANAMHGVVYLANALMPDDDRVAITGMTHAVDQSSLTVAYTVRPSRDWSWLWLGVLICGTPAAIRRRRAAGTGAADRSGASPSASPRLG
jgi:hypothetical protein